MDAIDHRILRELRRDGRISNVALAERVSLSPSACLNCFYAANSIRLYRKANKHSVLARLKPMIRTLLTTLFQTLFSPTTWGEAFQLESRAIG